MRSILKKIIDWLKSIMNEKYTIGIAGLIAGAVTMATFSATAQTTISVENDVNKIREELVVTRTETIDVETKFTLRQIDAEIAQIDEQLAVLDAEIEKYKAESLVRRIELVALRAEIVAELPVR